MPKKVLIVDDERIARQRIKRFLCELSYDFEVDEATSGVEALEKIHRNPPDLLLLDIQMPGLTGIEMLHHIENRPFHVIFQTAYDEFAIEAFRANACDYLLKPFRKERLQESIERALSEIKKNQRLSELEKQFQQRDGYLKRISVRQGDKVHLVDLKDVLYFTSRDHYTFMITTDSQWIIDPSLTHLAERLNPDQFVRCHRSHIVNLTKIKRLGLGENMTVHLDDNMMLPVARSKRSLIRDRVRIQPGLKIRR